MDTYLFVKDIFQVLGNPTRLKIFVIILNGAHNNCEIAELSGLAMNLISHHLKVLQKAGLIQSVRSKKDARWIYYSVDVEKLRTIQEKMNMFFNQNRTVNGNLN